MTKYFYRQNIDTSIHLQQIQPETFDMTTITRGFSPNKTQKATFNNCSSLKIFSTPY